VYYYIPKSTAKYTYWKDGFTGALQILSTKMRIDFINAAQSEDWKVLKKYDAILVKSNWDWIVDQRIQRWQHFIRSPLFLVLSGSLPPYSNKSVQTYQHIFYETSWYEKWAAHFPSTSRAFGVHTDIYRPGTRALRWDVLGIGALQPYKRWERLANQPGRKLVVGEVNTPRGKDIKTQLERAGVEVMGYQTPEDLRKIILSSAQVYIPAELQGGGERAVMEARACGVPVKVEADNPKLLALSQEPVLSHSDYAKALNDQIKAYTQ
jgi:glycosyltransferase involved in cell wall biosynthesis